MELGSLTWLTRLRLAIALVAIVVWFSAVQYDLEHVRLVGMALLAVALLLRFLPQRFHRDNNDQIESD